MTVAHSSMDHCALFSSFSLFQSVFSFRFLFRLLFFFSEMAHKDNHQQSTVNTAISHSLLFHSKQFFVISYFILRKWKHQFEMNIDCWDINKTTLCEYGPRNKELFFYAFLMMGLFQWAYFYIIFLFIFVESTKQRTKKKFSMILSIGNRERICSSSFIYCIGNGRRKNMKEFR